MNLETEGKISQAVPNFLKHYYVRNSHLRCSVKKTVFRNFTKFTGKHLCQRLFLIKLQARPAKVFLEISQITEAVALRPVLQLLKMSLWNRCFPVNFAKFLRTPFLQITSGRRLLLFPRKTAYSSNNSHNAYKNAEGNSKFI